VKVAAGEVPANVDTVTLAVPGVAVNADGTAVVNSVALTKWVVNGVVPKSTLAPATKPVPFTVSGRALPPAFTKSGLKLVMTGGGCTIVNVAPADVPPLVVTETLAVPNEAISDADTVAVNSAALR